MASMVNAAQKMFAANQIQAEVLATKNGAFLTADALVAYCASRLRGIDEQVQASFVRQQKFRDASSAMGKLQEHLAWLGRAPCDGIHADDKANFEKTKELYAEALARMPPGEEKNRLTAEFDRFKATTEGKDMIVSRDEAADMAKQIGLIAKDMSSSAELDMIQLQSFMSQRQQALQMCTNMVAGLGQASQQIAANIGK